MDAKVREEGESLGIGFRLGKQREVNLLEVLVKMLKAVVVELANGQPELHSSGWSR